MTSMTMRRLRHAAGLATSALSIFAFPGWQLGDAIARLSVCAFTCDSADRAIRIVF